MRVGTPSLENWDDVYMMCTAGCYSLRDRENQDLAPTMNAVAVHSKLVDSYDEVMIEHADLSFLWYAYDTKYSPHTCTLASCTCNGTCI